MLQNAKRLIKNFILYIAYKFFIFNKNIKSLNSFNEKEFIANLNRYISSLRLENQTSFKYAASSSQPNLYSASYAYLTSSMIDSLAIHFSTQDEKSFYEKICLAQSDNGQFIDPILLNYNYFQINWWGANHLAVHIANVLIWMNKPPKVKFKFLEKYYSKSFLFSWLSSVDWGKNLILEEDFDNEVFNITSLLQYSRDYLHDSHAAESINFIKSFLRDKINPEIGIWGEFDVNSKIQTSRMLQFAYHLFAIFFYDNDYDFDHTKIVKLALSSQNRLGGFGVSLNSSACEDIDSIDILIRLHHRCDQLLQSKIDLTLERAFQWILSNQMKDGGFIFRLFETFEFGSEITSSKRNESSIFATWFRTLSIILLIKHFRKQTSMKLINSPGYEYFHFN